MLVLVLKEITVAIRFADIVARQLRGLPVKVCRRGGRLVGVLRLRLCHLRQLVHILQMLLVCTDTRRIAVAIAGTLQKLEKDKVSTGEERKANTLGHPYRSNGQLSIVLHFTRKEYRREGNAKQTQEETTKLRHCACFGGY